MSPKTTTVSIRVRYPEVDRMGVAHHMHYLAWMELGRTDWLREAGRPYKALEEREGVRFPVTGVGVKYIAPAGYDDELMVHTTLASISRVRVRFEYVIERSSDGTVLAEGFSEHASTGPAGRPRRLARELVEALESW